MRSEFRVRLDCLLVDSDAAFSSGIRTDDSRLTGERVTTAPPLCETISSKDSKRKRLSYRLWPLFALEVVVAAEDLCTHYFRANKRE